MALHRIEHVPDDRDAPLVVLVHGSMDRGTSFAKVQRRLSDLRTVAYDRRGYARSLGVGPPRASLTDDVDDLLAVLDGRPAVVVGHSYGGDVALAAAQERPDVVRAVLAFEPPMPWLPEWPADSAGGSAVRAGDPGAAAEAFLRRMLGDALWERLPERTRADRRAEGPALLADMTAIRRAPAFDAAAVKVPVVVGCGSEARTHHRAATARLAELLPDAELAVIEGGGHGSHRSHPDEFAALVRRALERAG